MKMKAEVNILEKVNNNKRFTVPEEELLKQEEYKNTVRTVITSRYGNNAPKAFVHTYGCQGNVADGERIKGILSQLGYEMCEDRKSVV